jgi:hypothetical protein
LISGEIVRNFDVRKRRGWPVLGGRPCVRYAGDRLADIGWQRKGGPVAAFASDAHVADVPVDVVELETYQLARSPKRAGTSRMA